MAFPERQAVFERQCLAKADIPETFVPVGNQLPVIAYPVVNDMQMRMRRVRVAYDNILCIIDPHALHIGKHGKIDPVGTDEIDPVKTA